MKKKLIVVLLLGLISISLTGCLPWLFPELNNPPVIISTPIETATVGEEYIYNVLATDSDGDDLTYSLLTGSPPDMAIDENSGVISWTPTVTGDFDVTVEVSDGKLSDVQSFSITVSEPPNRIPVITSTPVTSVILGETYSYTVEAVDPDGDDLTYSLTTNPSTDMTIDEDTGIITWIPAATGSYNVTVEVSDGELVATQNFTVVVGTVNQAPIITSTAVTSATAGDTYTYPVEASDPEGDNLTYSLTDSPPDMTIDENSGVISWTPTAVGNFEVTVEVSDGELSATQSFTVEVIAPKRVVMVELFIQVGCYHCTIVEPILEQLAEDYGPSQMILLEEHLWGDGYDIPETNARYRWYIPSGGGTPDAFFNGLNQRRLGSSYNYSDYQSVIESELAKEAKINITASGEKFSSSMSISGNIINISTSNLENLEISGMIFEDRGSNGLRYLVLDIFDGQEVSSISPGGTVEFSFNSENLNWQNSSKVHAVIFVQAPNRPTKEILQAVYVN